MVKREPDMHRNNTLDGIPLSSAHFHDFGEDEKVADVAMFSI
jgi:hypothetical protein